MGDSSPDDRALNFVEDVLFVGNGQTAVAHYRCYLPARVLGSDHVGLVGRPPDARYATGIVKGESVRPNLLNYKVVLLQQVHGKGWLDIIKLLRDRGIVTIYEVDDWLHSIKNQRDHDFRSQFDNASLADFEMCMRACDGMIVSTDFLARTYRSFNRNIHVCENGVDVSRYNLRTPIRSSVNVGWAGSTGHRIALTPWLKALAKVMRRRPEVNFVSIGQDYATAFHEGFEQDRALAVPWAAIEQYPAAMTMLDIAIAPAAHTGFFRGKSDLRWLEAGALGIPIVAHPLVYPKIEHGRTGFHATDGSQVEKILDTLVTNEKLRMEVGENARRYVRRERSAEAVSERWREVIERVWTHRRM